MKGGTHERVSNTTIAEFRQEVEAFQQELTKTSNKLEEQINRVNAMKTALSRAPQEDAELVQRLHDARERLLELEEDMDGSEAKDEIGERTKVTPGSRMYAGYSGLSSTYGPTQMHMETIEAGKSELDAIQSNLNDFVENVMPKLQQSLEATGAPPIEN
jgi:uncharacterized protein (DUF3084 family)